MWILKTRTICFLCVLFSLQNPLYSNDNILETETINPENKDVSINGIFKTQQKKRKIRLKYHPEWEFSPILTMPLGFLKEIFPVGFGLNTQVNSVLHWSFLPIQKHLLYRIGLKSGFHYYGTDTSDYSASIMIIPIHAEWIMEINDLKIYPKTRKKDYTQWEKPGPVTVPYIKIFAGASYTMAQREEKTGYYKDYSRSASSFDPVIGAGIGAKYSMNKRFSLKGELNGWVQFEKATGTFGSIEFSGVFHYTD